MYSAPSPDFDTKSFASASTHPIRNSRPSSHKRSNSSSSSSIFDYLSQITPPTSPSSPYQNNNSSSRHKATSPKSPRREQQYPKSEQRLLQAHGFTRALFACTPCQASGSGKQMTARPGAYYLPSDIFDDDDVYEYCGGDEPYPSIEVCATTATHDYVATLNQDYQMKRV
mmetsp:Transcript_19003/g.40894  ORF Transcript_19003/g.40894 Transcript_19003/m.40894 type:complete len:170 (-) Transcript_19003:133-642(-)